MRCRAHFTRHESFLLHANPELPQAADTFKWWNWAILYIHSSPLCPVFKNKPIFRTLHFHLFERLYHAPYFSFLTLLDAEDEGILLPSNLPSCFLTDNFTGKYFCVLSQTSVDPDHEGHSPGHRGETILGVSSQWQAQALLHVAEERPTPSLRGKLLPVACHLPVFHF